MPIVEPDIVMTADGTPTLRHPVFGDTYHSLNGAVSESRHVFIGNGLRYLSARQDECADGSDAVPGASGTLSGEPVRILEVGFGSGLNAWLTLCETDESACRVAYTALELYPVSTEVAARIGYTGDPRFAALHDLPWGSRHDLTPAFSLQKIEADLADCPFDTTFDLVYFDAFAPDTQPALWSESVFRKVYERLVPGGVLATYSAKGTVKQALRAAGFEVRRLPGAPGKRHMLRAEKPFA